jgi:LysM repeat protein
MHIPKGTGSYLMAALQMVPAERRASSRMHTVESGETLASIGRRYRATPSSIAAANNIRSASPAVGDRLLIPAAYRDQTVRTAVTKRSHKAAAKGTASHHGRTTGKGKVRRAAAYPEASGKLARAQH